MKLLVIEDNPDIVANLFAYLEPMGYELDVARNGLGGLAQAAAGSYDAIVLDLTLPGLDGLDVARRLRKDFRRPTPILMLTARDTISDKVTGFAGSLKFVYLHGIWFAAWIIINIGLIGVGLEFDKFPFGLLTMIVSLEAIFLSTFVMVSQNRQAKRSDLRSQVDFESNLQSLIWNVHVAAALNVDIDHVQKLCDEAIAQTRPKDSH